MSTLEQLLERANKKGFYLEIMKQMQSGTWYACFRRGNGVVFETTSDGYGSTPVKAVNKAVSGMVKAA